jgi:hypothetical protein
VLGLIGSTPITNICVVESVGGTHEEEAGEEPADPDAVVGVEDDGDHFQYTSAGDLDLAGEATYHGR